MDYPVAPTSRAGAQPEETQLSSVVSSTSTQGAGFETTTPSTPQAPTPAGIDKHIYADPFAKLPPAQVSQVAGIPAGGDDQIVSPLNASISTPLYETSTVVAPVMQTATETVTEPAPLTAGDGLGIAISPNGQLSYTSAAGGSQPEGSNARGTAARFDSSTMAGGTISNTYGALGGDAASGAFPAAPVAPTNPAEGFDVLGGISGR